jgi:hypothetical protein
MFVFPPRKGIARDTHRVCRYLTVRGLPCRQRPLIGQDFCYQHGKHRHPVCPSGPNVVVPLIENPETVQLITTQVTQGIFAGTIDSVRAGKILYACQVAALTFPRPARLKPAQEQATPAEPVTEVFEAPDGELLGPAESTPAAPATFGEVWSYDKYRYEKECERLGRSLPATPADMPAAGWLDPDALDAIDEQANRGEMILDDGYKDKILALRIDADRRAALPPLAERICSYGDESWCRGPGAQGQWQCACARCTRERDEYCRLHPDQPAPTCYSDKPTDLKAVADTPGPLLSRPSTPLTCAPATPKVVPPSGGPPPRDTCSRLSIVRAAQTPTGKGFGEVSSRLAPERQRSKRPWKSESRPV